MHKTKNIALLIFVAKYISTHKSTHNIVHIIYCIPICSFLYSFGHSVTVCSRLLQNLHICDTEKISTVTMTSDLSCQCAYTSNASRARLSVSLQSFMFVWPLQLRWHTFRASIIRLQWHRLWPFDLQVYKHPRVTHDFRKFCQEFSCVLSFSSYIGRRTGHDTDTHSDQSIIIINSL